MTKPEFRRIKIKELHSILSDHQLWLETAGKSGKIADLSKARLHGSPKQLANVFGKDNSVINLSQAYLDGFHLPWANWSKINLHRANLSNAILTKANLSSSNLSRADLEDANLREVNFSDANLAEATLVGADLWRAKLNMANLLGANLSNANLSMANLENANLQGAILIRTRLREANLCSTKLKGVDWKQTDLTGIKIDMETVSRLPKEIVEKYGETFFILGISDIDKSIIRSIEFPPEYHLAGISILNYFGTVLRKKYPDQKAKIKIEQEELRVTMTVDPVEGDREIIEKALNDYGLVITGNMTLNEYTDDPLILTDLKNQLINAKAQLEMQRNILALQGSQVERKDLHIEQLLSVLGRVTQNPNRASSITVAPNFTISSDISPSLTGHLSQQASIELAPQISLIVGGLNELKEQLLVGSDEAKSVRELQESIKNIEKTNSPEDVARSSEMSKFRRFINDLGDEDSNLGKAIKGIKKGTDIARELAGSYNKIAQWCGLPQVPKPFTKK